jgi:hypothetical protein
MHTTHDNYMVSLPLTVLMVTLTACSFMQIKMAIQSRSRLYDTPNSPIKTRNCKQTRCSYIPKHQSICILGLVALRSCNATPQEYISKSPLYSYHFKIQELSASYLVQWSYQTIRTQQILQLSKKCPCLSHSRATYKCRFMYLDYMIICRIK